MVLRIKELKLRPDHTERELVREIQKILHLRGETPTYEIMRRSIDARKKPELYYVYTVDVMVKDPRAALRRIHNSKVALVEKKEYFFPYGGKTSSVPEVETFLPPVVVGSGPAGLFCALMLARAGLRPIVLERGEPVDDRVRTVNRFWENGQLNPQSNVQFGEGGAGTFSDGKLNTLIKDPDGKIRYVLKEFVRAGAPEEILYHHKPHIGTDVLVDVVRSIREEIKALGGEFQFNSCLTGISFATSNLPQADEIVDPLAAQLEDAETEKTDARREPTAMYAEQSVDHQPTGSGIPLKEEQRIYTLSVNDGERTLQTRQLVLAIGHSARDTFSMLYELGLPMQAKAFAVGLRIEHPQKQINDAMYGADCPYELGAAPYKLTHKSADGRGVYSFCMCPGGYVVNASSEPGRTAVNGMSYSDRGSGNANSAIVVTVSPEDYQKHPLAGISFQRTLEETAYACGGGKIPIQRFADFCADVPTTAFGAVQPQCRGAYAMSNLRAILPDHLNAYIIEGIRSFGGRISGFDCPDTLLSGVESRTSSPVRILRDETCQSGSFPGIYPCGEGAGYAGGITSAAVDGIRIAEQLCRLYFPAAV